MKRAISFLAIALSGHIIWANCASAFTIAIAKQDVQPQIDRQFPITEETMFSTVTLKNPKLDLAEGSDRIGLIVDAWVSILGGMEAGGLAHIDGALKYVRETGEFMLSGAAVKSVEIEGLSDMARAKVAELLTGVARDYFDRNPIFRLKKESLAEGMAMNALKSVSVKDGKILIELGLP